MALPWLGILDALIGVSDLLMSRRGTSAASRASRAQAARPGDPAALETRLGVMALKEAFERDTRRLDLERELAEAERLRADRGLRADAQRQAADREIARLRLAAGIALAGWLGTLYLPARLLGGSIPTRALLGSGWALLLAALACALVGQSHVVRAMARLDLDREPPFRPQAAGTIAVAFIVAGLALIGLAVLTT